MRWESYNGAEKEEHLSTLFEVLHILGETLPLASYICSLTHTVVCITIIWCFSPMSS